MSKVMSLPRLELGGITSPRCLLFIAILQFQKQEKKIKLALDSSRIYFLDIERASLYIAFLPRLNFKPLSHLYPSKPGKCLDVIHFKVTVVCSYYVLTKRRCL